MTSDGSGHSLFNEVGASLGSFDIADAMDVAEVGRFRTDCKDGCLIGRGNWFDGCNEMLLKVSTNGPPVGRASGTSRFCNSCAGSLQGIGCNFSSSSRLSLELEESEELEELESEESEELESESEELDESELDDEDVLEDDGTEVAMLQLSAQSKIVGEEEVEMLTARLWDFPGMSLLCGASVLSFCSF